MQMSSRMGDSIVIAGATSSSFTSGNGVTDRMTLAAGPRHRGRTLPS
jgi:hypothetical protein